HIQQRRRLCIIAKFVVSDGSGVTFASSAAGPSCRRQQKSLWLLLANRRFTHDDVQHGRGRLVKTVDLAGVALELMPCARCSVSRLQPFGRGIIVVAAEAVPAAVAVADLVAAIEHAVRLQRATNARK